MIPYSTYATLASTRFGGSGNLGTCPHAWPRLGVLLISIPDSPSLLLGIDLMQFDPADLVGLGGTPITAITNNFNDSGNITSFNRTL